MKIFSFLIVLTLLGCNTYNSKMNSLLERKAELESQYKDADSISAEFTKRDTRMIEGINRKYLEEQIATGFTYSAEWFRKWAKEKELILESKVFKTNIDSAEIYENNSKLFLKQLKSVEYSIDSLSKLK